MSRKKDHVAGAASTDGPNSSPRGDAGSGRWRTRVGLGAAAALVAVLAYVPSLGNGFVWDDRDLVVENRLLAQPGAIWKVFGHDFWETVRQVEVSNYYRPLVIASYALDRRAHGLGPRGYHATNLALHALATALLCVWLLEIGVAGWQAVLGAALFGAHPALAESVAWVSGRTDPLAAVLVLACLLADRSRARFLARLLVLVTLALALVAKELAVVTPVLLVLAAVQRGERAWSAVRARWDLLPVLAGYFALRHVTLGVSTLKAPLLEGGLDWTTRLAGALQIPGILLLPNRCRLEYGTGLPASLLMPGALAGVALLTGLGLVARAAWKARGAGAPLPLLVALGVASLVPAVVSIGFLAILGDRLVYLPSAFLLPAGVVALARLAPGRLATALALAAIVACGIASAARSRLWRNERTFWEAAAAEPHASGPVYLNLGMEYHRQGLLQESVHAFETAIGSARLSSGHYLLGLLYTEVGCDELAMRYYREALAMDPGYYEPANNLSTLLVERGRLDEAETILEQAVQHARDRKATLSDKLRRVQSLRARGGTIQPQAAVHCADPGSARLLLQDAPYLYRRGLERLRARNLDQARVLLEAAVHLDPRPAPARFDLAQCLALRGEREPAVALLRDLLLEDPSNEAVARSLRELESRAAQPDSVR